jgi:guanosine-3',5'-bis(diphosphate) 3'-pyrophosphohydrolase
MSDINKLLKAILYSAKQHREQRRKDICETPYINHPIEVCSFLSDAGVTDIDLLSAAILHDTVEDTEATEQDILENFGESICKIVMEVTDDKSLPKQERKRLQVEHAPKKSDAAKQLKLADKTCNVRDLDHESPGGWKLERKLEYLDWAENVVAGLRGVNQQLESLFDQELSAARDRLNPNG